MGRLNQQIGKAGEQRAEWFLKEIGAQCVDKISTPMKFVKGKAFYCKKSSTDFTACIKDALNFKASRIEVKSFSGDNLPYSILEPHQIQWLVNWQNCGQWSFVLWVHDMDCYLISFKHFVSGKSISVEMAEKISFEKSTKKLAF